MELILVCVSAFFTSGLTLFSGFGLGTLLLPVFALFFPVTAAVAITAVVHFLNNLFKLALLGKFANKTIVLRFGIPAILSAWLGATVLQWSSEMHPLFTYQISQKVFEISVSKILISLLMILFALVEILPMFEKFSFDRKYIPLGGVLSGFLGGISGHQGALRSAFLLKCDLSRDAFIGTGVMIACLVDISRLSVYSGNFFRNIPAGSVPLLAAATASAFVGAFIGNRIVKKVTLRIVQNIVSVGLVLIAIALGSGLI